VTKRLLYGGRCCSIISYAEIFRLKLCSLPKELHQHVITQTAQAFVTSFLSRCLRVNAEHAHTESSVSPLDVSLLLPRYKHSHKRLLLIDFEGTVWQRNLSKAGLLVDPFSPPQDAIDLLNTLAEDRRNDVWLLSGLPVKGKMEVVAEKVPNIGIVCVSHRSHHSRYTDLSLISRAENGCFLKPRSSRNGESAWISMVANLNLTWKTLCLEMLHYVRWQYLSFSRHLLTNAPTLTCSSRNELPDRLLRRGKPRLCGDSGLDPSRTMQTGSGLAVKLRKRRITSLTGRSPFVFCRGPISTILRLPVSASDTDCASFRGRAVS
jgi:hypothetical protein